MRSPTELRGAYVGFHVGGGEFIGLVGVPCEPAENNLGFAACVRQFPARLTLTMPAFVIRELEDRTAPILDRVDIDFVLSVGEVDGLAHDFGWVVNRVSCAPHQIAYLVGLCG